MVTKPLEIPKKSNVANAVNQAAEYLQDAIFETNPVEKERKLAVALRWLESTGVTKTQPPYIENFKK